MFATVNLGAQLHEQDVARRRRGLDGGDLQAELPAVQRLHDPEQEPVPARAAGHRTSTTASLPIMDTCTSVLAAGLPAPPPPPLASTARTLLLPVSAIAAELLAL